MLVPINVRNVRVLVLGMALLPHVVECGMAEWPPIHVPFGEPPAAYDEQWGRLVHAFTTCQDLKEDEKEIASAPRYGKRYAIACRVLNYTLEGRDQDKKEVVKRRIDLVYHAVQLAWYETLLLRSQKKNNGWELCWRYKLRRLEEKATQEGYAHLVKAETSEDKRRMFELQQENAKSLFELEQREAKEKFEQELQRQQEAQEAKAEQ